MLTTSAQKRIFFQEALGKEKMMTTARIDTSVISLHSSPVKYARRSTRIDFSNIAIKHELRQQLGGYFTASELEALVDPFGNLNNATTTVWLTTQGIGSPPSIQIRIHKTQVNGAIAHQLRYRKVNGVWGYFDVIQFRLGEELLRIASEFGWERASFANRNYIPSTCPAFATTIEGETILISSPIAKMSEEEFCSSFRIATKNKK